MMKNKRETKRLEKLYKKILGPKLISDLLESYGKDGFPAFNSKEELKLYEVLVIYTKEFDIQKWLDTAIPKLMTNNYIISSFFGNFLFAYRNCDNGFDESVIKEVLEDNTKMAVLIKKTRTKNIGTNERFCYNPEISFNDDFLNLFAGLDYGKYMLITDDHESD